MNLINKPEDQPTFYSRRWRTTSTPDLAFCTDELDWQINREVREQLGGSDNRPVLLTMNTYISYESTVPRWNYKRLTWKTHTLRTDGKAHTKLAIMCKLAETTWGANEQILKTVYEGSVRPVLEYSSSALSTIAKTNQQSLDKIQNQALRIMKSTSITFMEQTTVIQPLHQRRLSKGPSSSREIQVPPRSSHGEGRGPYQEHTKERQFHT